MLGIFKIDAVAIFGFETMMVFMQLHLPVVVRFVLECSCIFNVLELSIYAAAVLEFQN